MEREELYIGTKQHFLPLSFPVGNKTIHNANCMFSILFINNAKKMNIFKKPFWNNAANLPCDF